MQPYFLPYLGYFQLIQAVDAFVLYDNIKYTKKGWINRNRFLLNGSDAQFTIPLRSASDHLDVVERHVAESFEPRKLLGQWEAAYSKAPYFKEIYPVLARIVALDEHNLFRFIEHSIVEVCGILKINTPIIRSSAVAIDHDLKGQDKVLALCRELGCQTYLNAIGGTALYNGTEFSAQGIDLRFLRSRPFQYPQFAEPFVPNLSIIDVLMFNSSATASEALRAIDLVSAVDATYIQGKP